MESAPKQAAAAKADGPVPRDGHVRDTALRLAVQRAHHATPAASVVADAKVFADYLRGEETKEN